MKKKYLLTVLGLVGLVALGIIAIRYTARVGQSLTAGPAAGERITIRFVKNPVPVPDLTMQTLDGRMLSNRDWRGKVTLVNFWATWCPPCREEIPELIRLQDQYKDQLQIIGVATDEGSVENVRKFAAEHKINYVLVMETPELRRAFPGVFALPTSFVVDTEGRTVQKHVGLVSPALLELETRALAGLPVNADIESVDDDGKVLLSNAAQATEIPGVDLTKLTPEQKAEALKALNTEQCTCGCTLTVAQCRINDPSCDVSPAVARKIVEGIASR